MYVLDVPSGYYVINPNVPSNHIYKYKTKIYNSRVVRHYIYLVYLPLLCSVVPRPPH